MTTKDKASELVDKYKIIIADDVIDMKIIYGTLTHKLAKQCALISIDQLMTFNKELFWINEGSLAWQYFEDVKKEINQL